MNKEQLYRFISGSTGNESNICQIHVIKDGREISASKGSGKTVSRRSDTESWKHFRDRDMPRKQCMQPADGLSYIQM